MRVGVFGLAEGGRAGRSIISKEMGYDGSRPTEMHCFMYLWAERNIRLYRRGSRQAEGYVLRSHEGEGTRQNANLLRNPNVSKRRGTTWQIFVDVTKDATSGDICMTGNAHQKMDVLSDGCKWCCHYSSKR